MKSIFRSRVFWVNVAGIVAEILANQQFLALPFIQPAWTPYIAFAVFLLNLAIRVEGGAIRSLQVRE